MSYVEYKVRVHSDGSRFWYNKEDQFHREDGPAVEYADGAKEWRLNGKLHREDGPAFEYASKAKAWYLNGKLHREDGPAIEDIDGFKSWWLNGEYLTEEEFNRRLNPVKELTVAEISKLLGYEVKIIKE